MSTDAQQVNFSSESDSSDTSSYDESSDDDNFEDFDWPCVESSDPDPFSKYSTCNICYGKLKMRCLPYVCLHKFCHQCSMGFFNVTRKKLDRRKCPLCRIPIDEMIMYGIPKDDNEWDSIQFKKLWLHLTSEFRKKIYSQNLWVQELESVVEFTSEFYKDHPSQTQRLSLWLKREIQVLLDLCQCQTTCDYLIQRILDLITEYSVQSQEFKSALLNCLGTHTDHFIHEFYMFSCSLYDIHSFDDHAFYYSNTADGQKLKWNLYFDVQKHWESSTPES